MNLTLGIFGGTFDPIHLGHIQIAHKVQEALSLQQIKLIPCNQNILRTSTRATSKDRLAMARIAIQKYAEISVDDREIRRGGVTYSIDTVKSLKTEFPDSPLCLIMALDTLAYFLAWKDWQQILQLANLVVTNRPSTPSIKAQTVIKELQPHVTESPKDLYQTPHGKILMLEIDDLLPISATQIRAAISKGQSAAEWLDPDVWNYIQTHNLYRTA